MIRVGSRFSALVLLAISSVGAKPTPVRNAFEQFMAPFVAMGDFSGSILVARGDKALFRRDYGQLDYELQAPNGRRSRFHIASLSKTFTAAAVLLLENDGKLALSDRLAKYVANFPDAEKITLTQLLEHSSGLPDYFSWPEYPELKRSPVTLERLISIVKTKPLDFAPGTQNRYSNTGYAFLAYVIERVSGLPYGRFVRERLLVPAGMRESGTWLDEALIPFRANGYQPWVGARGLRNAPFYDKRILTGSGSLYSTTDDLWAWYRFFRSRKLFPADGSRYPFGWGLRKKDGRPYLEQSGRDPGFVSHMTVFPAHDLVVIVLGNVEVAADTVIADGLAALALRGRPTPPAIRAHSSENAGILDSYTGRYEVGPNFVLDVVPAGGHLFLRGSGGDFLPLDPTGKDTFFYRQLYVSVGFKRDDAGKVTALLWGGDYPCKRIGDAPPGAAEDLGRAVEAEAINGAETISALTP
jgi:CubicO group peptidase (beta-lactamase class C family)